MQSYCSDPRQSRTLGVTKLRGLSQVTVWGFVIFLFPFSLAGSPWEICNRVHKVDGCIVSQRVGADVTRTKRVKLKNLVLVNIYICGHNAQWSNVFQAQYFLYCQTVELFITAGSLTGPAVSRWAKNVVKLGLVQVCCCPSITNDLYFQLAPL